MTPRISGESVADMPEFDSKQTAWISSNCSFYLQESLP